jgi:hypothetical protein
MRVEVWTHRNAYRRNAMCCVLDMPQKTWGVCWQDRRVTVLMRCAVTEHCVCLAGILYDFVSV